MRQPATSLASFGSNHVVERIACGTHSNVYRVVCRLSGETRALKLATSTEGARAVCFEAALLERLQDPGHPGIARVLERGEANGSPWFSASWAEGGRVQDLKGEWWRQRRESGIRDRSRAGDSEPILALVYQLASALDYVHGRGIVHADVSPRNVLLNRDFSPILCDFGSAREQYFAEHAADYDEAARRPATPGYIAPERLAAAPWDSRADIYALGCIWYELTTGRPVFEAEDEVALAIRHQRGEPTPAGHWVAELAPEIEAAIAETLSKDPHARIPTAADVMARIRPFVGSIPARGQTSRVYFGSRMFGREQERARVLGLASEPASGSGITLIAGPPGSGKSRFLAEIRDELRRLGRRTLELKSDRVDPEAIGPLLQQAGAFEEHVHPLALFLDDADRSDPATRQRLVNSGSGASRPHLFMTCSLDRAAELEMVLTPEQLIRLAPLSISATSRMLGDMLAESAVAKPIVDVVQREAFGNPRSIRELVSNLIRLHLLEREDRHWLLAPAALDPERTAAVWAESVGDRLLELPRAWRAICAVAALLGDSFSIDELELVLAEAGLAAGEDVGALLHTLARLQFVTRGSDRRLRFTNPAYRALFKPFLEPLLSRKLHGQLAESLQHKNSTLPRWFDIGVHYIGAGESARAIDALLRAAQAAMAAGASADAIRALELAFAESQKGNGVSLRAEQRSMRLGVRLLTLYRRAGQHDALRDLASALLASDDRRFALLRARVCRIRAASLRVVAEYAQAKRELQRGCQLLEHVPPRLALARGREQLENRLALSWIHYAERDARSASQVLREVSATARRMGTVAQLAQLYMWRANAISLRRRFAYSERAVAFERRALALHLRDACAGAEATMARFDLAFMLLLGGQPEHEEASRVLAVAAIEAEALKDITLRCRVTTYQAIAARRLRSVDPCAVFSEQALEQALECGQQGYVGAARACRGWVLLRRGQEQAAEAELEHALKLWQRSRTTSGAAVTEYPFQWLALVPLLAIRAAQERTEDCGELVADLVRPGQAVLAGPLRRDLSRAVRHLHSWSHYVQAEWLQQFIRLAAQHRYL